MNYSDRFNQLINDFEFNLNQSTVRRTSAGEFIISALNFLKNDLLDKAESGLLSHKGQLPAAGFTLLGVIAGLKKNHQSCETYFQKVIEDTNSEFNLVCLAGDFSRFFGLMKIAIKAYECAISRSPHSGQAFLQRGQAYSEAGDVSAAIDDLHRAILLQPNLISAHISLGDEYRSANMTDAAFKCYRAALNIDPNNFKAQSGLDLTLALTLPQWHSAMLNDEIRNQAFEKAIKSAVKPGCSVLDIGTGTGLLAMVASRAGAKRVIGCESVEFLAEAAKEIVQQNYLEDKISILHKWSKDLTIGEDIAEPVDIIIAEIVDTGLLGENIIAVISDARRRLGKPGATTIPCGAKVYAAPIESKEIALERRVSMANGFNISLLNSLRPNIYIQTDLSKYDWRMLAEPVQIFDLDFTRDQPLLKQESFCLTPHSDGTAHCIAFWFDLHLSQTVTLSTAPEKPATHWKQAVYTFSDPVEIKQNEPIRMNASHNQSKITLSLGGRGPD
ncbi:MAG: hypothetical protein CMM75_03940 [Rhodospirillaceae bacterium]|nr:hypothetical protein [Rhodospirillaceae bacterium]